jgi:ABC-type sulfate/molybdate transport systems ATPase subunit
MREGSIEQVGVPEDVRRNPASPLVLAALGIPEV